MGKAAESILFIPDVHAPYHNRQAWQLLIKAAKLLKPDWLVCLGDFWDFYSVSSHSKDPRRQLRLHQEIEAGLKLHRELDALGAKNKVFVCGNHEERLERYLMDKAPALFDMLPIKDILQLSKRGWKYVPYKQHTRIGKLYVTHDCGYAGSNALTKSQATYENNVVIGHTHRMEYRVVGNATGHPHISASFGWLGDVAKVDYMHRIQADRSWALGFGVGYLQPSGAVHLTPVPIVQNRLVLEGETVTLG
jgi:predicted phosphodiesterase